MAEILFIISVRFPLVDSSNSTISVPATLSSTIVRVTSGRSSTIGAARNAPATTPTTNPNTTTVMRFFLPMYGVNSADENTNIIASKYNTSIIITIITSIFFHFLINKNFFSNY